MKQLVFGDVLDKPRFYDGSVVKNQKFGSSKPKHCQAATLDTMSKALHPINSRGAVS